jgi:hypothetical protein
MTGSTSTPFKCILFEKRVRFRLPADWLEGAEAGVGVFQPPQEGGGTLRVTSEVLRHGGPPGDGDLAAATRAAATVLSTSSTTAA